MNQRPLLVFPLALLLSACLPKDTRPPPGTLLVTTSPSFAMLNGVTTDDGWQLSFGRSLLSVAHLRLDGSSCSEYYSPDYGRIFTFDSPTPQKMGTFYMLGVCDSFGFGFGAPDTDALLGTGVSDDDKTTMRTAGTDAYSEDTGTSAIVTGSATKGDVTKTFSWTFRVSARVRNCDGLTLHENEAATFPLVFHGEELFHDTIDDTKATLRFQPFAAADTDGNGEVTLDELGVVSLGDLFYALPSVTADPVAAAAAPSLPKDVVPSSLRDWVYLLLLPQSLKLTGGKNCEIKVSTGSRSGGGGFD